MALHGAGALVRVPQPARYAVHKLLIAQKRAIDSAKAQKDLDQARALFECLASQDPDALQDALDGRQIARRERLGRADQQLADSDRGRELGRLS